MQGKFPVGTRLSEQDAKDYVDELYRYVMDYSDKWIFQHPYMQDLKKGKLPEEAIRVFWLNWHGFVAEVNNLIQCAYQRHLGFFKQHPLLWAAYADKVADELIHPKPPGHLLVVWDQGEIFGLTKDEMLNYEMLPQCRIYIDWVRGLLYEGTKLEFWSSMAFEEVIGHWARAYREGLENYGYAKDKAPYFTTHEEADLEVHEGGVMAHGEFNRQVLQALLQEGYTDMRPGFSVPYTLRVTVELFAWFLDACYARVEAKVAA